MLWVSSTILCPFRPGMTVTGAVRACHGYTSNIFFNFKVIITIEAGKWHENYNSDSNKVLSNGCSAANNSRP